MDVLEGAEVQVGLSADDIIRLIRRADTTDQFDAATALFYAIYHSGRDNIMTLPKSVLDAYARCCTAFDPKGTRRHL